MNRNAAVLGAFLAAAAATVPAADAATFTPGTVTCDPATGHCYQHVAVVGNAGQYYSWADVTAFAEAQSYQGLPGHLLAIEAQAEFDSPLVPKSGYLSVSGVEGGPFSWAGGPAAGSPVDYFAPTDFIPAGGASYCRPFTHLCLGAAGYYGAGWRVRIPPTTSDCTCEGEFVVEYEADLTAPQAQVVFPNGGEQISVNSPVTLRWTADDPFGPATAVDLRVSYGGPDGPYTDVALGVPNTGSYSWASDLAATVDSVYFQVTARDAAGNVGLDRSDAAFTLYKTVPTLPATWGRVKSSYR